LTITVAEGIGVTNEQERKNLIGVAGEFLVAGELLRRGVHCSVTYGNAKKVDVVAFSQTTGRFIVLEVKTTSRREWIIGSNVPEPSDKLWAFVFLPPEESQPPQFFILSALEINAFLGPQHEKYLQNFRIRNGREFVGPGVQNVTLKQAEPGRGQWQKVLDKLS